VPGIDTVYRDLTRMDCLQTAKLELIMARRGLDALKTTRAERVHCDIDTTVEPLFGGQGGNAPSKALPIDPGAAVSSPLASARMQCAVVLGRVQGQLASRGPPAPLDTPAGCEIRRLRAQGRGRLDGTPTSTSA